MPVSVPERIVHPQGSLPGKPLKNCVSLLEAMSQRTIFLKPWLLYLTCRDISDVVLTPVVKKSSLYDLGMIITESLEQLQDIYPGSITPKVHYLVHYPGLILKFGPLRVHWCMCFEGKHQNFKKLASVVCNFRNICATLAKRHQMRQCWEITSVDVLRQKATSDGRRAVPLRSLNRQVLDMLLSTCGLTYGDINLSEHVWKVDKLTIDTVNYHHQDYLIVDLVEEEEIPIFFKIVHILQFRNCWVLCCKLYKPKQYLCHLHAFEVEDAREWIVMKPGSELDYHALDGYPCEENGTQLTTLPSHTSEGSCMTISLSRAMHLVFHYS